LKLPLEAINNKGKEEELNTWLQPKDRRENKKKKLGGW
jgi:hypothetical protein